MSDTSIALLGEYNGTAIQCRPEDEYFNATQMCKANGKRFNDWERLAESRVYLRELSLDTGIPVTKLVEKNQGAGRGVDQSTWVHELVAMEIAQWCHVKFKIWCNKQINCMRKGQPVQHREHAEARFWDALGLLTNGTIEVKAELASVKADVADVKNDVADVKLDVAEVKGILAGKRKNFSVLAIQCATESIERHYQGKCPQCRSKPVEHFHHWRQSGGCSPRIMLPLCKPCHLTITSHPEMHDAWHSMFAEFQRLTLPIFRRLGCVKSETKPAKTIILPGLEDFV